MFGEEGEKYTKEKRNTQQKEERNTQWREDFLSYKKEHML